MQGDFLEVLAYEQALSKSDPVIYQRSLIAPGAGAGDLHYGVAKLLPGRIGPEYFFTKGHLHAWRPASEVYLCLRGEGRILLEDEQTGEGRMLPFGRGCVVYVPGGTAHRTVNVGDDELIYFGVYPAGAGHDCGLLAERNFRHVIIEQAGAPVLRERREFLESR